MGMPFYGYYPFVSHAVLTLSVMSSSPLRILEGVDQNALLEDYFVWLKNMCPSKMVLFDELLSDL